MILNLACCFSSPRYRVFRKRSCFLTTPNTCSTLARTEDFAYSAFGAAYCPLLNFIISHLAVSGTFFCAALPQFSAHENTSVSRIVYATRIYYPLLYGSIVSCFLPRCKSRVGFTLTHEKDTCVYFIQKNILGFGWVSYRQETNISDILNNRNKAILLGGDTCNNFKLNTGCVLYGVIMCAVPGIFFCLYLVFEEGQQWKL